MHSSHLILILTQLSTQDTVSSHFTEEEPEVYGELRVLHSTEWQNLVENPGVTDCQAKSSYHPASQASLATQSLLPGRQPSGDVNWTTGWKFCLSLRRDQGAIETWVSDSIYRVFKVMALEDMAQGDCAK